jgi:hypothetical protein
MRKELYEEIKKGINGKFQDKNGCLKFVFYLEPMIFEAITNSIEKIDIDKIYGKTK